MTDRREAILSRIEAVLQTVPGILTVARMQPEISESDKPALMLLDGDEQRLFQDSTKPGMAPDKFLMSPVIQIFLSSTADAAGPALNTFRAGIIKAMLDDVTLADLLGPNGAIRYMGCDTGAKRGRRVEADMALLFDLIYVLEPSFL